MSWVPRGASNFKPGIPGRRRLPAGGAGFRRRLAPLPARSEAGRRVAGEEAAACVVGDVPRRVPRDAQRLEGDAGKLERLVTLKEDIRRVRAKRDAFEDLVGTLEGDPLDLGHVDLRAGSLGQIGDAAEVVPVAVRDQDTSAPGTDPRELEAE